MLLFIFVCCYSRVCVCVCVCVCVGSFGVAILNFLFSLAIKRAGRITLIMLWLSVFRASTSWYRGMICRLVALLGLSSCCLMAVWRLFLAVPWGCLRFVIVVFPDRARLLFLWHILVILIYI